MFYTKTNTKGKKCKIILFLNFVYQNYFVLNGNLLLIPRLHWNVNLCGLYVIKCWAHWLGRALTKKANRFNKKAKLNSFVFSDLCKCGTGFQN